MKREYKILRAYSPEALESVVTEHLEKAWELQGGASIMVNTDDGLQMVIQAMYLPATYQAAALNL